MSVQEYAHVHRKGFVCNVLQRDGNLILFAFIYIHLRAHNTHIIALDVKYVPHTIRKYVPNVWSSNHHIQRRHKFNFNRVFNRNKVQETLSVMNYIS